MAMSAGLFWTFVGDVMCNQEQERNDVDMKEKLRISSIRGREAWRMRSMGQMGRGFIIGCPNSGLEIDS